MPDDKGHGGRRTPEKPAAASGPGKLSKRTDGGPTQKLSAMTDQEYGARSAQLDAQRAAGMAAQDAVQPNSVGEAVPAGPPQGYGTHGGNREDQFPASQAFPFNAPSARPGEPVTAGVDIGAGGGSNILPALGQTPNGPRPGAMSAMLSQLAMSDTTGQIAKLYMAAMQRGA